MRYKLGYPPIETTTLADMRKAIARKCEDSMECVVKEVGDPDGRGECDGRWGIHISVTLTRQ